MTTKTKYEHQPCDQQPLMVKCPADRPCCWKCEKGNCHHYFVFGTPLSDYCLPGYEEKIKRLRDTGKIRDYLYGGKSMEELLR